MARLAGSPPAVVRTRSLRGLLPYYRDVLGFRVLQHVPGVLALLQFEQFTLQLWQRNDFGGHSFCVVSLDGRRSDIQRLHAAFRRCDAGGLMERVPALQPRGSWEFGLVDPEGNQVVFEQWVTGLARNA
ncbi:hypothetical protein HK414_23060 [Ramlibacter terrae]|uniref:VOC family protein n=1 Tax=Ramlibacter terrae TaxID=2732511 RepID=A0ABX6P560_9BURK|nr:hypothetical protein HK414_23060 [Ramlibacter terrae]